MRKITLGAISALVFGVALSGTSPVRAADLGYGYDDEPATIITRRTTVERRVVRPRPVVREIVVERPVIYRPRPVVHEVVVERPIIYPPRPRWHQVLVEPEEFYGPRPFRRGPRPGPFGYGGPAFGPYD